MEQDTVDNREKILKFWNAKSTNTSLPHSVSAITARFEKELNEFKGNQHDQLKQRFEPSNLQSSPVISSPATAKCTPTMVERVITPKRTEFLRTDNSKCLLDAVKEGNLDVVKWLIAHGADPNLQDSKGRNALLTAACNNKMDVFKYLLDKSDINEVDLNGWNIIHIGAVSGQLKIIQEAKDKLSINSRSRSGLSPLCLAANKGHVDIIEYLLKEGADVSVASNQGWTSLHFAARGKNFAALYTLINSGKCEAVLLNSRTSEGQTPLSLATQEGCFECVRLLLDSGANPSPKDNRGWTPARIAAINNFTNIVQYLSNYGASM